MRFAWCPMGHFRAKYVAGRKIEAYLFDDEERFRKSGLGQT